MIQLKMIIMLLGNTSTLSSWIDNNYRTYNYMEFQFGIYYYTFIRIKRNLDDFKNNTTLIKEIKINKLLVLLYIYIKKTLFSRRYIMKNNKKHCNKSLLIWITKNTFDSCLLMFWLIVFQLNILSCWYLHMFSLVWIHPFIDVGEGMGVVLIVLYNFPKHDYFPKL